MCERCVELIRELSRMHNISEADLTGALWEHTAYPFSSQEESAGQLREWAAKRSQEAGPDGR